ANVLQYWSPTWRGLTARLAYGTGDTNVGSTANGVSEASGLRPALYSGTVIFESGAWYATLAGERHKDFQSLNTLFGSPASSGKDDGLKAGLQYSFNSTWSFGGIVERLKYQADNINGLAGLERKVTIWYVVGKYNMGLPSVAFSYGQQGCD